MLSEAETEADNKGSTNKNFYSICDCFLANPYYFWVNR